MAFHRAVMFAVARNPIIERMGCGDAPVKIHVEPEDSP
jgi:hypothetical protein